MVALLISFYFFSMAASFLSSEYSLDALSHFIWVVLLIFAVQQVYLREKHIFHFIVALFAGVFAWQSQSLPIYNGSKICFSMEKLGIEHDGFMIFESGEVDNVIQRKGLNKLSCYASFERRMIIRVRERIRTNVEEMIDLEIRREMGFLYRSLLVPGDYYDYYSLKSFKDLGLIHLVVLSGLHIGLISGLIYLMLNAIPRSLYVLGVLPYPLFRNWEYCMIYIQFVAVAIFCFFVGFPISCQRAFCSFIVGRYSYLVGIRMPVRRRIFSGIALHICLFPWSVLDQSFILSWAIYISVFANFSHSRHWQSLLKTVLLRQMLIALILLLLFTEISVFGFVANLMLSQVFSWYISSIILTFIACFFIDTSFIQELQLLALDFILDEGEGMSWKLVLDSSILKASMVVFLGSIYFQGLRKSKR